MDSGLKFAWKDGTHWKPNGQGFYASLIIYNVPNGIGSVEQSAEGGWKVWLACCVPAHTLSVQSLPGSHGHSGSDRRHAHTALRYS